MLRHISRTIFATLLALSVLGHPAGAIAASDLTLYRALGERPGLTALMDKFLDGLLADKRTEPFFGKSDHAHVKLMLVELICDVIGGPCEYAGEDMTTSHEKHAITAADFNALVEVLQVAMDQQGIPVADQNRLLARLAPMHRAIITRR